MKAKSGGMALPGSNILVGGWLRCWHYADCSAVDDLRACRQLREGAGMCHPMTLHLCAGHMAPVDADLGQLAGGGLRAVFPAHFLQAEPCQPSLVSTNAQHQRVCCRRQCRQQPVLTGSQSAAVGLQRLDTQQHTTASSCTGARVTASLLPVAWQPGPF